MREAFRSLEVLVDEEGNLSNADLDGDADSDGDADLENRDELFDSWSTDHELSADESADDEYEQFSGPPPNRYDPFDFKFPDDDSPCFWVIVAILKFQERFRLSEVATNALFQIFRIVLLRANPAEFNDFPTTLHVAKRRTQLVPKFDRLVACPKCHKLYMERDIRTDHTVMRCSHVEFPRHPQTERRQPCGTPLAKQARLLSGVTNKPVLIFPLGNLKQQLHRLLNRNDIESKLRHWTRRNCPDGVFSDIFDGRFVKDFRLAPGNETFFRKEYANSRLPIMINLDWFQPYKRSVYSVGAIYGVVCSLPREDRFRPENTLLLGLLPGPREVGLHQINHYLAPIVDQFIELMEGVMIPTLESPSGKKVQAVLIGVASDVPATRKICGYISAQSACHRCQKRASNRNFAGFDDYDEWFRERDPAQHRQDAENWRACTSAAARKAHTTRTRVRWSELLRLPYFDPVRCVLVDPMHNLFLGICAWVVKRCWIDSETISADDLKGMDSRLKDFQVPSDIGRLPRQIGTGDGFSNFTADQWKSFILVYAVPLMWDLLRSQEDKRILLHLVRACFLLTSRIITKYQLAEAHEHLLCTGKLIERVCTISK